MQPILYLGKHSSAKLEFDPEKNKHQGENCTKKRTKYFPNPLVFEPSDVQRTYCHLFLAPTSVRKDSSHFPP